MALPSKTDPTSNPTPPSSAPQPSATAVYGNPAAPVGLRIGTGGAGESGLLEALADAFIASQDKPFSVEWYTTHTSDSIDYLRSGIVDVVITYHGVAELMTLEAGIAERVEYAWRDHWMLVGPKSNPANLPLPPSSSSSSSSPNIYALLTHLASAMESSKNTSSPIRFLSRYDKSANSIKESTLWSTIGLTPWVDPSSSWYHKHHSFPFQALRQAAELGEYTITDRGTWCAVEDEVREGMVGFIQGSGAENDPLLNPAHLMVGRNAVNKEMAGRFADWMVSRSRKKDDSTGSGEGGQDVVERFEKHGMVLYEAVPDEGVEPLGAARRLLGRQAGR